MVIKLDPLLDMGNQLMRVRGELEEEAEELTCVFRRLEELSGMEDTLAQLRRNQQQLQQEAQYAYRQARALEQIVHWYGGCEQRIQMEYEDTALHYPRSPGAVVNLASIAELLK